MDRAAVFGTVDGGSIPSRGTLRHAQGKLRTIRCMAAPLRIIYKDEFNSTFILNIVLIRNV